jgi:hypothetical protein
MGFFGNLFGAMRMVDNINPSVFLEIYYARNVDYIQKGRSTFSPEKVNQYFAPAMIRMGTRDFSNAKKDLDLVQKMIYQDEQLAKLATYYWELFVSQGVFEIANDSAMLRINMLVDLAVLKQKQGQEYRSKREVEEFLLGQTGVAYIVGVNYQYNTYQGRSLEEDAIDGGVNHFKRMAADAVPWLDFAQHNEALVAIQEATIEMGQQLLLEMIDRSYAKV